LLLLSWWLKIWFLRKVEFQVFYSYGSFFISLCAIVISGGASRNQIYVWKNLFNVFMDIPYDTSIRMTVWEYYVTNWVTFGTSIFSTTPEIIIRSSPDQKLSWFRSKLLDSKINRKYTSESKHPVDQDIFVKTIMQIVTTYKLRKCTRYWDNWIFHYPPSLEVQDFYSMPFPTLYSDRVDDLQTTK